MKNLGSFLVFIGQSFSRIASLKIMLRRIINECIKVGYNSLFIVIIVSTFTGAVSAIQTAFNLTAPYIENYVVAQVVRDTIFSLMPTLIALIYSGKVGSYMASEIGTMKISEQIDALEVMGINAKSFLVLPKIIASFIMFPMLITLACFMAIYGGYMTSWLTGLLSQTDYIIGIRSDFNEFIITIILIKALVFGLVIPSISCYEGFKTTGGSLEVGKASTSAVVNCCIAVLVFDYLLTQILATQ